MSATAKDILGSATETRFQEYGMKMVNAILLMIEGVVTAEEKGSE